MGSVYNTHGTYTKFIKKKFGLKTCDTKSLERPGRISWLILTCD
jgi:hypothetical protein